MKRSQQCLKCKGRKLWVIERYRLPAETAQGVEMSVVPDQSEAGRFGFYKATPVGAFDLWMCEDCGYAELWGRDIAGLREDAERGIRRVDASVAPVGPFR